MAWMNQDGEIVPRIPELGRVTVGLDELEPDVLRRWLTWAAGYLEKLAQRGEAE